MYRRRCYKRSRRRYQRYKNWIRENTELPLYYFIKIIIKGIRKSQIDYRYLKTKLVTTNKDKMSNIQLTSATNYDVENIVCSEPKLGEVPKDDKKKGEVSVNFMRINVSTKYPDGTVGDLIIPTPELFSFGVGENTSQETGQVTGHTMSLCLWNRDRQSERYLPTEEQLEWTNTYNNIVKHLKKILVDFHKQGLLSNKSFTKYRYASDNEDAEENGGFTSAVFQGMLGKLNNLYWGKGKKKGVMIDDGEYENGPTLYAKLIESKKKGKIVTQFYDYADNPIDPLKVLMGVYCNVIGAIKIESIFIGNSISLQVKLYEANCKILDGGMARLLPRQKSDGRLLLGGANDMSKSSTVSGANDDLDNEGSLHDGSDAEEVDDDNGNVPMTTPKKVAPKVQARRKVKPVPSNK